MGPHMMSFYNRHIIIEQMNDFQATASTLKLLRCAYTLKRAPPVSVGEGLAAVGSR